MPIRNKISSSKYLIKLIFALNIPKNIDVDFDMTTLLLRYCITREIKENKKIFEMGIGTGALLSNFIAKRYKSQVYGADISERRVEQSKIVSKSNDIKSFFLCSNLFENITDKYDYIIFNPPYVPTSIGEKLNLKDYQKTAQDRLAWDGVKDGMSLIEKFLEEGFQYLNKNGKIILGVQGLYITREKIQNCILKKEHIYLANI